MSFRLLSILMVSLFLLALVSCKPYPQVSSENLAESYGFDHKVLCSDPYMVHISDSLSMLNIIPEKSSLLFTRSNTTDQFKAHLQIRVLVFNSYFSNAPTDSITYNAEFLKAIPDHPDTIRIPLNIRSKNRAVLYLAIKDVNRNYRHTIVFETDKSNRISTEWYEPIQGLRRVNACWYCYPGDTVMLNFNGSLNTQPQCFYYNDTFDIPSPPFQFENPVNVKLEPDEKPALTKLNSDRHLSFIAQNPGLYFVTTTGNPDSGFALICTSPGFPDVASHLSMLGPLRYITTQKEFDRMANSEQLVTAIEEFWLKTGGQEEHARNLIKNYYSRVLMANQLFSSHTEGWKTDRGMIYIVFGPPNIVYRNSNSESWIYGEENNFFSITFVFDKLLNKFSENDYFLQRTPVFKDNWYRAVDIWRQ